MIDYKILDKLQNLFNKDEYLKDCRGAIILEHNFGSIDIKEVGNTIYTTVSEDDIKTLKEEIESLESDLLDSEREIHKHEQARNDYIKTIDKYKNKLDRIREIVEQLNYSFHHQYYGATSAHIKQIKEELEK